MEHTHEHGESCSHDHAAKPEPNFTAELRFRLLFHDPAAKTAASLAEALRASSRYNATATDDGVVVESEGRRFTVRFDGKVPLGEERDAAVMQSWNWREAERVVPRCTTSLVVADHEESWKEWSNRVRSFRTVLADVIELTGPDAVFAESSQQFLEPTYLAEALEEQPGDELFGFVNVRLFKIEGHDRGIEAEYDETVMDTIGLGALGLPDLQCHFKHLDPSLVAQLLYGTAHYIFEQGPVIASGHQLQGLTEDQKWTCQLEQSIVEPLRLVLDVNPGSPYAAGGKR